MSGTVAEWNKLNEQTFHFIIRSFDVKEAPGAKALREELFQRIEQGLMPDEDAQALVSFLDARATSTRPSKRRSAREMINEMKLRVDMDETAV